MRFKFFFEILKFNFVRFAQSLCHFLVDFFKDIWYDSNFLDSLKKLGLNVVLVSPELHNRKLEINKVKDIISSVKIDAICTDHPDLW